MEILGMEKVSFVDYENKICATLFTGGCNFSCPFCHNSGIVQKDYEHYTEEEILRAREAFIASLAIQESKNKREKAREERQRLRKQQQQESDSE